MTEKQLDKLLNFISEQERRQDEETDEKIKALIKYIDEQKVKQRKEMGHEINAKILGVFHSKWQFAIFVVSSMALFLAFFTYAAGVHMALVRKEMSLLKDEFRAEVAKDIRGLKEGVANEIEIT